MDPISTLPTSFAFVTYAQAICALRARNILNDYVVDKEKDAKIVVKVLLSCDRTRNDLTFNRRE